MSNLPQAPSDRAMYDRSAEYYLHGRLDYSPTLLRHMRKVSRLDKSHTILDIGCGPGNIANAMAPHAGRAIGVDPSIEMLRIAEGNAPDNASFIEGTLDDVDLPAASVRLATFGRSFHWTDRERVLDQLDRLLDPDGCIAILNANPVIRSGGPHDWYDAVIKRLNALTDEPDPATPPFGKGFVRHEFLVMRSAFSVVQDRGLVKWSKWNMKKLTAFGLSRYKASKEGPEVDAAIVRKTIKRALRPYGPGPWYTLNQHRVLIASRPK